MWGARSVLFHVVVIGRLLISHFGRWLLFGRHLRVHLRLRVASKFYGETKDKGSVLEWQER
jgi:hypothetical protein